MGLFALVPVYLWLPETLDPEKIRKWGATEEHRKPIFLNPFKSLALLRSPNILIIVRRFASFRYNAIADHARTDVSRDSSARYGLRAHDTTRVYHRTSAFVPTRFRRFAC